MCREVFTQCMAQRGGAIVNISMVCGMGVPKVRVKAAWGVGKGLPDPYPTPRSLPPPTFPPHRLPQPATQTLPVLTSPPRRPP
eukprot:scaffold3961_cov95-Isochrysis_galbana.AAC.1